MKRATHLLTFLILFTLVFTACKRDDLSESRKDVSNVKSPMVELIESAHKYFNEQVLGGNLQFKESSGVKANPRQMLQKTALWENAYIAKTKNGDVVIVPLKFEKELTLKIEELSVPLSSQAKLYMFRNNDGGFRAEVVTKIPDRAYAEQKTNMFSGVVLVEDWAGNGIKHLFYQSSNTITQSKDQSKDAPNQKDPTATSKMLCTSTDWYWCQVDEVGNYYDCEYMYTETYGCDETGPTNLTVNPDSGGGEEYEQENTPVSKPVNWTVTSHPNNYFYIKSYEELSGIKNNTEHGGYFTVVSHTRSTVFNNISNYATWMELSGSTTVSATESYFAHTYISGKATDIDGIDYEVNNKPQVWYFKSMFP